MHLLVWFLSESWGGHLFRLSFLWFLVVLVMASPNWSVFWTCYLSSSAGLAVTGAEEQFFLISLWFSIHKVKLAGWCGCQAVSTDASQQEGSDLAPLLFSPTVNTDAREADWSLSCLLVLMIIRFGSGTTSWSQLRKKPCSCFHEEKRTLKVRKHTGDAELLHWDPPSSLSVYLLVFVCLQNCPLFNHPAGQLFWRQMRATSGWVACCGQPGRTPKPGTKWHINKLLINLREV